MTNGIIFNGFYLFVVNLEKSLYFFILLFFNILAIIGFIIKYTPKFLLHSIRFLFRSNQ